MRNYGLADTSHGMCVPALSGPKPDCCILGSSQYFERIENVRQAFRFRRLIVADMEVRVRRVGVAGLTEKARHLFTAHAITWLLNAGVLCSCLFEDRKIGIGLRPESKNVVVGGLRLCCMCQLRPSRGVHRIARGQAALCK
jgi:hypothetical protein